MSAHNAGRTRAVSVIAVRTPSVAGARIISGNYTPGDRMRALEQVQPVDQASRRRTPRVGDDSVNMTESRRGVAS